MAVKKTNERKFPIEALRKNSRVLFDCSSTCFEGATAHLTGGEYTVQEMKAIIDDWCNSPAVHTDKKEE